MDWISFLHNIQRGANSRRLTKAEINKRVQQFLGSDYKLNFEFGYKNNSSPIELIHITCGRKYIVKKAEYVANYQSHSASARCPFCYPSPSQNAPLKFNQFVNKYGYTVINGYKNYRSPIKLRCKNGHIIEKLPQNLYLFPECKYCKGYPYNGSEFRNKVLEFCKRRHISQQTLAELSGIERSKFSRILLGEQKMSKEDKEAIISTMKF